MFDECDVGNESEPLLEEVEQRVCEEEQDTVDEEVDEVTCVYLHRIALDDGLVCRIEDNVGEGNDERSTYDLRTLGEFTKGLNGYHAYEYLQEQEFVRDGCEEGYDGYCTAMEHEGCTTVHEDADDDGQHTERQYEDVHDFVGHHDAGNDAEEYHQCEEQKYGTGFVVIVATEEVEVDDKYEQYAAYEYYLSDESEWQLFVGSDMFGHFTLVGTQDVVGFTCDYLATVDDFLTALDDTTGCRYAGEKVVACVVGLHLVEHEVGREEFVEVKTLHDYL